MNESPKSSRSPFLGRLAALAGGGLFGAGLVLSGMTEPQNVLAFLTLGASWSPALMAVMGTALAVAALGYGLATRQPAPLLAATFHTPVQTQVDRRLLLGAGVFGLGWGLSGYCPGPALVGAMTLDTRAVVFLLAFLLGLGLHELMLKLAPAAAVKAAGPSAAVADG